MSQEFETHVLKKVLIDVSDNKKYKNVVQVVSYAKGDKFFPPVLEVASFYRENAEAEWKHGKRRAFSFAYFQKCIADREDISRLLTLTSSEEIKGAVQERAEKLAAKKS